MDNLKPYCSAYPYTTVASGPELNASQCGKPSSFIITACDKKGTKRTTGGDIFTAQVMDKDTVICDIVPHDDKNGVYTCYYNCPKSGNFNIIILSEGTAIKGSPYPVVVHAGNVETHNCVISGDGLKTAAVGKESSFKIETKDKFGNAIIRGGAKITVTIEGGSNPKPQIQDLGDGTYIVNFTCGWADEYEINIQINGTAAQGCPFFCAAK